MAARNGIWGAMLLVAAGMMAGERAASPANETVSGHDQGKLGQELFSREWVANDARSHGGDGLGPVFNERSCVACHSQGGIGGGGPIHKNVRLISAFASAKKAAADQLDFDKLATLHPGLRTSQSVIVHRMGTRSGYDKWRIERYIEPSPLDEQQPLFNTRVGAAFAVNAKFQEQATGLWGGFRVMASQRNPTALFGAGLIDSIPEGKILERATLKHPGFPEVKGRASRLANGKIGRFGWKAEKASLRDFAMTACAVELGLQVPDQAQSVAPDDPGYNAPGLDMSLQECEALVSFLMQIPAPTELRLANATEASHLRGGEKLFTSIGCATCHAPKLGRVSGIYSDLLLHDVGPQLSSPGTYYGVELFPQESLVDAGNERGSFGNGQDEGAGQVDKARERSQKAGSTRGEWRTPPLWGVHNSAPYLHDGRAATLEEAIQQHGGEAEASVQRYAKLSKGKRKQLIAFLDSLVAPQETPARPR